MAARGAVAVAPLALLVYCLACGDDPSQPGTSVKLDVVAGNGQTAQVLTERGGASTGWTITSGSNTLTITVGSFSVNYMATGT